MRIKCPTCGGKAVIRSSRALSATLSHLYCLCMDPCCALGFVLSLEYSHATSPSALDLPETVRNELPRKTQAEMISLFTGLG